MDWVPAKRRQLPPYRAYGAPRSVVGFVRLGFARPGSDLGREPDVNVDFGNPYNCSHFGGSSSISNYARSGGAVDRISQVIDPVRNPAFAAVANSPSESSGSCQPSPPVTHCSDLSERQYQCPEPPCSSAFKHKKDLARHLKSKKHATGHETVYGCRCGKEDTRKDNHLRHVHFCEKPPSPGAQYVCTCQSSTCLKEEHVEHVRSCRFGLGARGRPAAF
ncbi:hypothetical protein F5Y18DRAFT_431569 [Xylariaceae sp. FL1019]|nr:hypothetical protein F5Y18DRAFT_431569 [Xylariaceae sp. FL1019]